MTDSNDLSLIVQKSLDEDIGSGDITSDLIPDDKIAKAFVMSRDNAIVCGVDWVNETFKQIDKELNINWHVNDGDTVKKNEILFTINGSSKKILTGERTALNFLQLLSGIATECNQYVMLIEHTQCKLLDTRKTIPGLRRAQKFAIKCGGGNNHRMGLYDSILIKENHISACGSIEKAICTAKKLHPEKSLEIEVESIHELEIALKYEPEVIMLDNFKEDDLRKAVALNKKTTKLEASGNITKENIKAIAETGVDFISIGSLTKNIKAIDLSLKFYE